MQKINLSKEEQETFTNEIIRFFKEENNEEIGIIKARNFLDLILEEIAPKIYNKGIEASQQKIKEKIDDIDFELEEMKK